MFSAVQSQKPIQQCHQPFYGQPNATAGHAKKQYRTQQTKSCQIQSKRVADTCPSCAHQTKGIPNALAVRLSATKLEQEAKRIQCDLRTVRSAWIQPQKETPVIRSTDNAPVASEAAQQRPVQDYFPPVFHEQLWEYGNFQRGSTLSIPGRMTFHTSDYYWHTAVGGSAATLALWL